MAINHSKKERKITSYQSNSYEMRVECLQFMNK